MSATLNAGVFSSYFSDAPLIEIEGRTFPVTHVYLEDILKTTGYIPYASLSREGRAMLREGAGGGQGKRGVEEKLQESPAEEALLAPLRERYRSRYNDKIIRTMAALQSQGTLDYDLVAEVVAHICTTQPEGAILVFCPGWFDITTIIDNLVLHPRMRPSSRYRILPLHGSISNQQQNQIFQRCPPGVRKIVVATNIAETSITIDDVVYVVDTGQIKEKSYDPQTKLSSLLPTMISRANANQRAGRAGRLRPGFCYRLYSSLFYDENMEPFQIPELLRVSHTRTHQ